ncbi:transcriptional regulator, TetR family [Gordonia polyisoprenivorans VH2]|uniref:Transcriptional regulator, TetR family n=2 Tax=Gordonia polyisoprenivorans TaxID=84595 RepID=H6MVL1_GORPV|nr:MULTISPECIES: TetR/AcrR family transcriptional regulator [Gordonia]AFA74105.1 transcriptional regulator, TetR family [Gordonia polyisoprenivorans VH2]MBE7193404.1 TetR/AcrR family transcriptional regulator [Gordonia polyisoprenivorans]MDF3283703.1 TetR/AcrR family transcriptional regulator [Gordonia sp. N1V]NKY03733.1 TetR/AcrR family transcriptional regulator [Gordonia polyisoprenivorans]OPX14463.1 TetR family transcriptional regulator [Gordonia sp. i37]
MSESEHNALSLRLSGTGEPERADAARNRRLLLAAAQTLIDTRGAAAVTMDAVAAAAGVGKGTVFRRFGSRTGLMHALLDHSESELQQAYLSGPEPLGPGAPPLDRLLAYGRARLKMTVDHLDILLEAGADSGEFMKHPVWRASTQHVQILLRQLGFGDDVHTVAIAVQAPLAASSVQHLTDTVGLDVATITDQWERMVRTLAAGCAAR